MQDSDGHLSSWNAYRAEGQSDRYYCPHPYKQKWIVLSILAWESCCARDKHRSGWEHQRRIAESNEYCLLLLLLPLEGQLSIKADERGTKQAFRWQSRCILENTLLEVICNALHCRDVDFVPLLGADDLFCLLGAERFPKCGPGFKSLKSRDGSRLETLESFNLMR